MLYVSTRNPTHLYPLSRAVLMGLAPDGGLFLPQRIPALPPQWLHQLSKHSFQEIALEMLRPYLMEEFSDEALQTLVAEAFTFQAPLVSLNERLHILELFHGPTLAFKDFGARFMAQVLKRLASRMGQEITILVATSGDTGSAVAHGFWRQEGIRVVLLYPAGMVSTTQEQQLTAYGENVTALRVEGTFDDCQRLVKTAFQDEELRRHRVLTSANSINIARLLPQSVYYAAAVSQLPDTDRPVVVAVPSGNLGNLTGGVLAWKMGIPIAHFVAALNTNDVFREYLTTGQFSPRRARPSLSNAMDVGNPSNLERLQVLFQRDHRQMQATISAVSVSDAQTLQAIAAVQESTGYLLDPHGAVAWQAIQSPTLHQQFPDAHWIVLATAHPAKFNEVIQQAIGQPTSMPQRLQQILERPQSVIPMSAAYEDFREFLMAR